MSIAIDWKQAGQYFQAQCSADEVALLVGTTTDSLRNLYQADHGKSADFDAWASSKSASGRALLKVARFKAAVEGNASAINAVTAEIDREQTKSRPRGFGTAAKSRR